MRGARKVHVPRPLAHVWGRRPGEGRPARPGPPRGTSRARALGPVARGHRRPCAHPLPLHHTPPPPPPPPRVSPSLSHTPPPPNVPLPYPNQSIKTRPSARTAAPVFVKSLAARSAVTAGAPGPGAAPSPRAEAARRGLSSPGLRCRRGSIRPARTGGPRTLSPAQFQRGKSIAFFPLSAIFQSCPPYPGPPVCPPALYARRLAGRGGFKRDPHPQRPPSARSPTVLLFSCRAPCSLATKSRRFSVVLLC